jgi:3-hydroxyacyl-[acyl-carrier-protein] dehydratase
MMTDPIRFDIAEILRYLPHRYPFLLVDRVLECVPGESITALKNVTYNEPFFPGHFPGRTVMPGVMIIEALAQATGILAFASANVIPTEETRFYFVGIDKARFRKPVVPGDQLILKARVERALRGIWKFDTTALVGETEVAHANMMVAPETGK